MSPQPTADYTPTLMADGVVVWAKPEQQTLFSYREEKLEDTKGFGRTRQLTFVPWGKDNLHPLRLLNLFAPETGNAVFSAVMRDHAAWIRGRGLVFEGDAASVKMAKGLFNERDLYVWAYDLALFNSFAALEVYEADAEFDPSLEAYVMGQRMVRRVHAVDVASVRVGAPQRDEDGQFAPEWYYYAQDWRQIELSYLSTIEAMLNRGRVTEAYLPELTPAKGLSQAKLDAIWSAAAVRGKRRAPGEREEFMLRALHYDLEYHPASWFYPMGAGESALTELETAPTISAWYKTAISNGMAPSSVIRYPKKISKTQEGMLTKTEIEAQRAIMDGYLQKNGFARNAGVPMFLFYDPDAGQSAPEVLSQPTDNNDKRWGEVSKEVQQRAFTALGVVQPEMYGIATPAGFSSKAETLELAYQITEQRDLAPRRARLERYLNSVIQQQGIAGVTVRIERAQVPFERPISVSSPTPTPAP